MQRIEILLFLLAVSFSTGLQAQAPASAPKPEPTAETWSDPSVHKGGFVTANGVRLNYLDWGGSGPTLTLIHGLGDNPHLYDNLAPAFTDRFRVIAYARRGEGDSEAKEPYDGLTLAEAFMRDYVVVKPLDGSVRLNENEATEQALVNSLLSSRRDYTKVRSPALAIYAATMADSSERQKSNVRADSLAWEEKYVSSLRKASIERARRELSSVEIMTVTCCHRDIVFACRDTIVAAMRRFLSGSPRRG